MVILLELIFQGFFEWVYGLILECWNFFSSALLDIMSLDFAYIKTHVPVVNDIMGILLAVGWALLLGNLVFQALKSMVSGLGFEGEDPKLLFARTFVFAFLLLASPQICEIVLDITSRSMALLDIPDVIDVHLVDSGLFGTLSAAWLLVIICDIIIMFKVLSLLLEVAERYVILAMLTITAPLAFAMGGSKNTAEIFSGWCRMFGSMCLLMVTNVVFFKMLISVVSTIPSGLDVFPWMVLIISIVKVAKKADEIITRIGLNPAITGDRGKGFGSILTYTIFRTAFSKTIKTLGAAAGCTGKAAAGAAAGGAKAAGVAGAAGAVGAAGAAAARAGTRQGGTQETKSQQVHTTERTQKSDTSTQAGSGQSGGASPSGQAGRTDTAARKTAVPTGTRRAPSHVPGPGAEISAGKDSSARRSGTFGGETGRGTIRHSGKIGGGAMGGRRAVNVLVDDNFDDGGGSPRASGVDAGGGMPGMPKTAPQSGGAETKTTGRVSSGSSFSGGGRRGGSFGTDTGSGSFSGKSGGSRSSRKPEPSASGVGGDAGRSAPGRSQGTTSGENAAGTVNGSTFGGGQRGGRRGAAPQTGGSFTEKSGGSRSGRKSADVSKTSGVSTTSSTSTSTSVSGGSFSSHRGGRRSGKPGPAGTGAAASTAEKHSPAVQPGTSAAKTPAAQKFQPSETRSTRRGKPAGPQPGSAGTVQGSSAQLPPTGQRSPSPAGGPLSAKQESGKAPAVPLAKGAPMRPGPTGTGTSSPAAPAPRSQRRSTDPARQEPRKTPTSAESPKTGGAPAIRPGPAGTAADGKRAAGGVKADKYRTTRANPGKLKGGGTSDG